MDSLHTQSEEAKGALLSLHGHLDTLQCGLEEALDNVTLVAEDTSTSVAESPLQVVEVRAELDANSANTSWTYTKFGTHTQAVRRALW